MKKIFTLIVVLSIGFSMGTTAQVLFEEDFDNISGPVSGGAGTYVFPTGWTLLNADGLTPATNVAYVNAAWERREDFANDVTDSAAFSTSWYAPAATSNDWMWTPPITLTTNCVLSWKGLAYDATYPDGYEVRIWTAGGTPTSVLGSSTVLATIAAENPTWTSRQVNLQTLNYQNQTVRIGFRNNSNDQFLLLIDDVMVSSQVNNDVELLSLSLNSEYTIVPVSQLQPISGSSTIRNSGLLAASNVNLEVDVYDGTPTLLTTVPATPVSSLASGATSNFTTPAVTAPAVAGIYYFDFNAVMTEVDQMPNNNFLSEVPTLIVDQFMYARDNGTATGSLGIGAGNGGYVGNSFEIVTPTYLDSIMYYVTEGDAGQPTSAVVWNTVGGVPSTIIASTATAYFADDLDALMVLGIENGPVLLNPGEYVVTAVEYDSTLNLATTEDIFTAGKSWVDWPTNPNGVWSNPEDFGFDITYIIRMILTDTPPVGVAEAASGNVSIYPNPSNGSFTIEMEDVENHADMTVMDVSGRQVHAQTFAGSGSMKQSVNLDLSAGSYLVKIVSGSKTHVSRIVLQ